MKGGRLFAFAGLWESWGKYGEEIRSCTILTTEANHLVGEVHHRMPVILPAEDYGDVVGPGPPGGGATPGST